MTVEETYFQICLLSSHLSFNETCLNIYICTYVSYIYIYIYIHIHTQNRAWWINTFYIVNFSHAHKYSKKPPIGGGGILGICVCVCVCVCIQQEAAHWWRRHTGYLYVCVCVYYYSTVYYTSWRVVSVT